MRPWVPFLQDFDKTLIETLKTIQVTGEDGSTAPITVTYFAPEHQGAEDREYILPAVVLHMYDEANDRPREQSRILERVGQTESEVTLRELNTPTRYFYQMTVVTEYQMHLMEILQQINRLFKKRGYITVVGPNGEKQSYDFFQNAMSAGLEQNFLEFGANRQKRIFRRAYKYILYAEVDDAREEVHPIVTEVNVKTEEQKG